MKAIMNFIKMGYEKSKWNEAFIDFCGHNETQCFNTELVSFNPCCELYALICPSYALFAVISAFYISSEKNVKRTNFQSIIVKTRILITFLLLVTFLTCISTCIPDLFSDKRWVYILTSCVAILAYVIHIVFLCNLTKRISLHCRGPTAVICAWLLNSLAIFIHIRSVFLSENPSTIKDKEKVFSYVFAVLLTLYLLTLIPNSVGTLIRVQNHLLTVNIEDAERTSLLHSGSYSESYIEQISSPVWSDLGVALDDSNIFSRLTFSWVNSLMHKGNKKLLLTVDSLYELPHGLRTSFLDTKFWILYKDLQLRATSQLLPVSSTETSEQFPEMEKAKVSLLRTLISCFGVEFFMLGIMKFISDSLSFSGPLLLNLLLTNLDHSSQSVNSYYYALGLFLATFLNAILSSQFQFLMGNLSLKIRAAIITTVFRKSLSVNLSGMAKLSTGEIVNFMSTDTDRIQNICPSFHQLWSLPLQIAVCLYLLHDQVKNAILAGIAFAVMLIPINHLIAKKIAKLSIIMMEQKDKRVKLMSEILSGIQVIKFNAWEDHFSKWIGIYRNKEIKALKGRKYLDAACVYFWATTPVMITLLTFVTYLFWYKEPLTSAQIFTSIALVNILIFPLNAFPWVINGLVEAWVSLKRIQNLLWSSEINYAQYYLEPEDKANSLQITEGDFSWKDLSSETKFNHSGSEEMDINEFTLRDINLEVPSGQLIGVIGEVGSGKTSLLNAILGEMYKIQGKVFFSDPADGIGYVSQEAWIQQGTVRRNILFGKNYDSVWYKTVIDACALSEDISGFPNFDETEIGERGITLSGGQKARISLARAVYQNKMFYCLDDPLSAVDAEVATHIFNNCILGVLRKKTCILCTHQIKYLERADLIFVMKKGNIIKQGNPSTILSTMKLTPFTIKKEIQENEEEKNNFEKSGMWLSKTDEKLIQDESKEQGPLKLEVYKEYWKAVGSCLAIFFFFIMLMMQGTRNATDGWLAYWSSSNKTNNSSIENSFIYFQNSSGSLIDNETEKNLIIYGSLAGANSLLTLVRAFLFTYGGIVAAKTIHEKLLKSILKGHMLFFVSNPLGRILNRFSSDLYAVDDSLPFILNIFFAQSFSLIGSLIVMCFSLPWITVIVIPLLAMYISTQNYYRHTSREMKRLSAIALSPIYAHFSETLAGLAIIRSFRAEAIFQKENEERLEKSQRALFALQSAGQWLNFRLQIIGVMIVTSIAFFALLEPKGAGFIGLALSYALSVTSLLSGVVWSFTETEKEMVSTERAFNYIHEIEPEKWEGQIQPPYNWPNVGEIQFRNTYMCYKENYPFALKNVSFIITPGMKVGIIGRTGSGKSSLFQVLFRLVELTEGEVIIDKINIKLLDLKRLRSSLTIIPQDPVLFSTTVRNNLDPKLRHSDDELWATLAQCCLKTAIEDLGGLDVELPEKGTCFSVGQRQLFCLARALLTKAKILCIDEATANVDHETDRLIQQTIHKSFESHTVVTIAHRVQTVMNSDKIMVMSDGKIKEFDTPENLLSNENSLFYKTVHRND